MKTIISIVFIIASVCTTVFFILPQYNCVKDTCGYDGIKSIRSNKIAYTLALKSAQDLESRRENLTQKYNSISSSDRERLEAMLPNNVDNIKLVLELETLAKKYGLLIESPKLETKSDSGNPDVLTNSQGQSIRSNSEAGLPLSLPYGTFTLDFTVRSTYSNIKLLISDIERNLRLIEPVALTIKVPGMNEITAPQKSQQKSYPPDVYDVTLRAVIYYLKN